jgi:hypothetical protein
MRRINARALPLILFGGMLLLSLLGAVTGVASFLLLRAGYGFLVWGLLPPLVLLLVAIVLVAVLWRAAGGPLPGVRRPPDEEEGPRGESRRREHADDV